MILEESDIQKNNNQKTTLHTKRRKMLWRHKQSATNDLTSHHTSHSGTRFDIEVDLIRPLVRVSVIMMDNRPLVRVSVIMMDNRPLVRVSVIMMDNRPLVRVSVQLNLIYWQKTVYIRKCFIFRTDSRCNYGDIDIFWMYIYEEIVTSGVNNWAILRDWHGGVLTNALISYPILELASIFWYHWMYNIQEGTIHMLTYSYTESNRPQRIKIRVTYLSRLFISTGKMYTTSDLRSISHVHAVFALPSVPRVI